MTESTGFHVLQQALAPVALGPVAGLLIARFVGRLPAEGVAMTGTRRIAADTRTLSVTAAGVAVWAGLVAPGTLLWTSCILGWMLLALAAADVRCFLLPDALTLPLAAAGLAVTSVLAPDRFSDHLLGAGAGLLAFAAVRIGYRRLRAREGLGLGDVKLLGAIGAWVAWEGLPSVVLIAALTGIAGVMLNRAFGNGTLDAPLPFGAHLALAGWLVWLYGPITVLP